MRIAIYFLISSSLICSSCKKFIEIPPPGDQLTTNLVFENDQTAIQAVTGIYSEMMDEEGQFSNSSTTLLAGLCADELGYFRPAFYEEFANNEISEASHPNLDLEFWSLGYRFIYAANRCIEGASQSALLSAPVKQMVIGEAKLIRAFCYYYLANLFGDVPLILTTDYKLTPTISRTSKDLVIAQIVNDLIEAQNLLLEDYPSLERARPNKFAASALLARVYLQLQDWSHAEEEASLVINSGLYSLEPDLNSVFLVNSNETIWQLRPVTPDYDTWEAFDIIPPSSLEAPAFYINPALLNAFELNDQRKNAWLSSYDFSGQTFWYPYKYKNAFDPTLTEYYVVLRLAEQYLIRAEARAELNKLTEAAEDINQIRSRAGLNNTTATDQPGLLNAIAQENRVELFAEWGHRWFDLKRTGTATAVLSVLKPAWQATDELWPIPKAEIDLNPSLTQNPGY